MVQSSYLDVFSISSERGYDEDIHVGDLVCTGPNLHPQFCVIAVDGDTAWVRNVANGADGLTKLNKCRKVEGAAVLRYDPSDSSRVKPYPGR